MARGKAPLITKKMKDIAKRFDPTERIKKHNEGVKNLVLNKKVMDTDPKYLFAFLNRLFFSDILLGVAVEWSHKQMVTAAKVSNIII
jgi:hypothetical protein